MNEKKTFDNPGSQNEAPEYTLTALVEIVVMFPCDQGEVLDAMQSLKAKISGNRERQEFGGEIANVESGIFTDRSKNSQFILLACHLEIYIYIELLSRKGV